MSAFDFIAGDGWKGISSVGNELILRGEADDMDVRPHAKVLANQGVSPVPVTQIQLCNMW